jgi:DNA polymerase-3 subunit delta
VILQGMEDLETDLRTNGLRPVYLILGPEQYQCRLALDLLKSKAISPESKAFDYSEFFAGDASIHAVIEAASTFPMVSKRRLVILAEAEKLEDSEQDALLDSLQNLSARSMLILSAADLDHRKRFFKTFRERFCVAEFPKLKGPALERWAEAFVRRKEYKISSAAIKKIVELAGPDMQTLASELEKLLLYAGKEKTVPNQAIDELVRASRQHGIFDLIGAVAQRDRNNALKLLANLLSTGEHPIMIVNMMARHCRQVLIAKEYLLQGKSAGEIGNAIQMPGYFLDQFLRQASTVDLGSIQKMYVHLAEIDRRIKTSYGDGRMMLEKLICALV